MTFESLGLSDKILEAVTKKGYTTPSPIQEKAIPVILERKDVLASAQTGTGKTAGFTLPLLQILNQGQTLRNRPVRALILTPTRELAAQVYENVREYSQFTDLKSTVIFGGVNAGPQIKDLKRGVDILVATPGRLLDLINQKVMTLDKVEIMVLDEADRMLDMGFSRDINRIIQLLPTRRQNLLFSATFSKEIKKLANGLLNHPVTVEATPENTTAEKVFQRAFRVDQKQKPYLTIQLIEEGDWSQVLIFTRTKHKANKLSEQLEKKGITSAAIHGNKSQAARTKALDGFKKGKIRVLVATDIAARGLDIPLLPHVINFELPNVPEDYVHRIGRTGRAGAKGEAISLVSVDEIEYQQGIEKLLGQKLRTEVMKGFEPTETEPTKSESKSKSKGGFRHSSHGGSNGAKQGGGNSSNSSKKPFRRRRTSNY
ncbi:DEAD/DEAH box helicase [Reichenbachiella agarivorans]|uniref:DEAD/DEAH box helicase n=1 Tax=Reichenbachiella agarivorans TaxID=2979464 RepID=A0ABY6CS99_9BACT|nr:DEAD/DEAH box helicase [Reichenbachiella agarivorans]UXP33395.1 DEAD/DEAH box helicase [Reichenbachiella agarivorans]